MSQGTKAVLDDLKHAGEFTKIENTAIVYVLRGWFGSLSAIPGRVGSRRRRLGVYHASRTFRQQTQSRPDRANPGTGEYPWGVTEKSEGNAGSGGRNFGSQIGRGRADQQTRGCIC